MLNIRKSGDRGYADHGWLRSFHSFSFADYYDPEHIGFGPLRVINEDRVAPGKGFGTHGHRDMEIVSYVLDGALEHKDSMGTGSIIRPGEVQRMSAGTGVLHSERNPSPADPVRFLQIWILPRTAGLSPGYEQKTFPEAARRGRLCLAASPTGRDGSVTLHQEVDLYLALLAPGERVRHALRPGRHAWIQVARGEVAFDGALLKEGDGVALSAAADVSVAGSGRDSEILLFDLP